MIAPTLEPNDKTQWLLVIMHSNLFNHISISFRSFLFQGSQGPHCLSFSLEINTIICFIFIPNTGFIILLLCCGLKKLLLLIGMSSANTPVVNVLSSQSTTEITPVLGKWAGLLPTWQNLEEYLSMTLGQGRCNFSFHP